MSEKTVCTCNDNWKVGDITDFFNLPDTSTQCPGTWYGKKSEVRKVEIKTESFKGACKVVAVSGEAYTFFKKGKTGSTLACQNVFSNWAGGEFLVTFWMKDNGPAPDFVCTCSDSWKVADVIDFFALPNTNTTCPGSWHGDPSDTRKIEIKNEQFLGACKVIAISAEAYTFFKKGKTGGTLACQNVFADWDGGEFLVTFWMKDHGSA